MSRTVPRPLVPPVQEFLTGRLISRLGAGTDTIASCPVTWFGKLQRKAALHDQVIDLPRELRT